MPELIDNLLRFKKDQRVLVFDTETEGLNLLHKRPFQASWIVCKNGKIQEEHDYYINWPDLDLPNFIKKLTGFKQNVYDERKEPPEIVLDRLENEINDPKTVIVGQNLLGFDVYMLKLWRELCGRHNNYSYLYRLIDTNCLAKAQGLGVDYDGSIEFIFWQYRLASFYKRGLKTNQKFLLEQHKIDFDPNKLHNSLYDVKMCYEIFKKQIYKVNVPELC